MLRICALSTLNQSKGLFKTLVQKEITSKIKCLNSHNIISRYYAKKVKSEDENLECVYYGPLTPQIKGVKVFSLSSSVAGLIAQPIIVREAAAIGSTPLLVAICSVVGFFTFVTPILLHIVTKKYVTEIHYSPDYDLYKATTYNFFLRKKEHEFTTSDVEVPDVPGLFTTLKAKGTPLFIEARHFNDPTHYAKIMGYDKPMDFKLGEMETEDSQEKK